MLSNAIASLLPACSDINLDWQVLAITPDDSSTRRSCQALTQRLRSVCAVFQRLAWRRCELLWGEPPQMTTYQRSARRVLCLTLGSLLDLQSLYNGNTAAAQIVHIMRQ